MTTTLDVLTFNLNNPSRERAGRQLAYLAARPESVLVLTETADSAGCTLLKDAFRAAGFYVEFPRPPRGERGAMIVSRLAARLALGQLSYLPHRAPSVSVDTDQGRVEIVGLYVPSRDASPEKIERKTEFLKACRNQLPGGAAGSRLVIGDFNILEPTHTPRYRFFRPFEYGFYTWFTESGYVDAYRTLHPEAAEYSWVGRTGDGYRYDHAHVSAHLAPDLSACSYVHEVRTGEGRLTDHSALTVSLALRPTKPLPVTVPDPAADAAPALF